MISRYWLQGVIMVLMGLVYLGTHRWAPDGSGVIPARATPEQQATVEPTPRPAATPAPTPIGISGTVTITVVYDNNAYDPRLRTAWGFSCLVELVEEMGKTTILFEIIGKSCYLSVQ